MALAFPRRTNNLISLLLYLALLFLHLLQCTSYVSTTPSKSHIIDVVDIDMVVEM
jgi:hypothetical protein